MSRQARKEGYSPRHRFSVHNRVKRLVRDTFRRHMVKHSGLDCVVSLRERFDAAHAEPVFAEIRNLFDQLAKNHAR